MTDYQNSRFESLLDAWRRHDELRRSGASISELAHSRATLDDARWSALSAFR